MRHPLAGIIETQQMGNAYKQMGNFQQMGSSNQLGSHQQMGDSHTGGGALDFLFEDWLPPELIAAGGAAVSDVIDENRDQWTADLTRDALDAAGLLPDKPSTSTRPSVFPVAVNQQIDKAAAMVGGKTTLYIIAGVLGVTVLGLGFKVLSR